MSRTKPRDTLDKQSRAAVLRHGALARSLLLGVLLGSLAASAGCGTFGVRLGLFPVVVDSWCPGCGQGFSEGCLCGVGPEYHATEWYPLEPGRICTEIPCDPESELPEPEPTLVRELAPPPRTGPVPRAATEYESESRNPLDGSETGIVFPEPDWPEATSVTLPDVLLQDGTQSGPTEDHE